MADGTGGVRVQLIVVTSIADVLSLGFPSFNNPWKVVLRFKPNTTLCLSPSPEGWGNERQVPRASLPAEWSQNSSSARAGGSI